MRQCTTRRDSRENSDLPTLKMFLVCSSVNAARSNTVTGQPTGSQPPGRPVMTISSRPPAAASTYADTEHVDPTPTRSAMPSLSELLA